MDEFKAIREANKQQGEQADPMPHKRSKVKKPISSPPHVQAKKRTAR